MDDWSVIGCGWFKYIKIALISGVVLTEEEYYNQTATLKSISQRLIAVALTLSALGLVMVYSASCVKAGRVGVDIAFLYKQIMWVGLGLVAMFACSKVNFSKVLKFSGPLLLIILGLLVAVKIPGVGTKINGAYRWLRFGGINMQPSELAKLGMLIILAGFLARNKAQYLTFWKGFVPAAIMTGVTAGLIMIEPDFGTAALVGSVMASMIIVGGGRLWHAIIAAMIALPPAVYFGMTRFDHISARVNSWMSGETSGKMYQVWMSMVALGSGGVSGMGFGEGVSKLYYLPEAHTDFILAIIGQELGLCGTIFVLLLFMVFVYEGIRLVRNAPDKFSALLAYGITAMLGLQAAFNMAVVTGSVPPKGISLPFISFGGSGLCVALASIGVMSSLCRMPARRSVCSEKVINLLEHKVEKNAAA